MVSEDVRNASTALPHNAATCNLDELLMYQAPQQTFTTGDLGIACEEELCDFAVCTPFQLLSPKCVRAIKEELRADPVQKCCKFTSARTPCTLRGVSRHCPTLHTFWSSQRVTDIVSGIVGMSVRPVMEYELGVCNIQVPDNRGNDALVDDWHKDSYPIVAIVMLSDPAGVVGGETAIRRGDGSVLPINFPTAGSCAILQGQQVVHCGRRALSAAGERITMVTSYVPSDPCAPDRSVLRGPRPVSNLAELYYDWAKYRLASLAGQATARLAALEALPGASLGAKDLQQVKRWLDSMEDFVRQTRSELQ